MLSFGTNEFETSDESSWVINILSFIRALNYKPDPDETSVELLSRAQLLKCKLVNKVDISTAEVCFTNVRI